MNCTWECVRVTYTISGLRRTSRAALVSCGPSSEMRVSMEMHWIERACTVGGDLDVARSPSPPIMYSSIATVASPPAIRHPS